MKIGNHPIKLAIILFFSFFVAVTSFVLTSSDGVKSIVDTTKQQFSTPVPEKTPSPTPETKIPPTRILIPKLNKSLPVTAALIHDNEWDLFDDKVSWLSTSAIPGEGNVILYAHNTQKLFGDLHELKVGDSIEVQQGNQWTQYTVTESRKVTPTDVEAVLGSGDQLTLYTCEGSFYQKRRVVYASPIVSPSSP